MKALWLKLLPLLAVAIVLSGSSPLLHTANQAARVAVTSSAGGPVSAAQGEIRLDARSVTLNAGDYRVLRVDFAEAPGSWEALESPLLHCEKLSGPDEKTGYLRVTALSAGSTEAGVRADGRTVKIPVTVKSSAVKLDTQREVALETGDTYGFLVTVAPGAAKPEVRAQENIARVESVEKEGLPPDTYCYLLTAMRAGTERITARSGGDTAAFPLRIGKSGMELKAQSYGSATDYLILTDLAAQRVGIFRGSQGGWRLEQSYPCSSGASGSETPRGEFRVTGRGSWFYNRSLQSGAKWYVQFKGDFLFHSLPMNADREITDYRLGQPLSHGCVRLTVKNAKWMYDNMPNNTKVVIY